MRWIYKPAPSGAPRRFPRPLRMHVLSDSGISSSQSLRLRIDLLGRGAVSAWQLVARTVEAMRPRGSTAGTRVSLAVEQADCGPAMPVAQIAALGIPRSAVAVRLDFVSPCVFLQSIATETGRGREAWRGKGDVPLRKLVGSVAYELAAWDIHDRGLGSVLDRSQWNRYAYAARDAAETAVDGISAQVIEARPAWCITGKRRRPGFTGSIVLRGELLLAIPWLSAMVLLGAGQERGRGFGRVQMRAIAS